MITLPDSEAIKEIANLVYHRHQWAQDLSAAADVLGSWYVHLILVALSLSVLIIQMILQRKASLASDIAIAWNQNLFPHIWFSLCLLLSMFLTFVSTVNGQANWAQAITLTYTACLDLLGTVSTSYSLQKALRLQLYSVLLFHWLLLLGNLMLPALIFESSIYISPLDIARTAAAGTTLLIAFVTPRTVLTPNLSFNLSQRPVADGPSPEETCSAFSYFVSYDWVTPLILRGTRRTLSLEDLPALPHYDEPLIWLERTIFVHTRGSNLLWTLLVLLRSSIARMIFCASLVGMLDYVAPFAMYQLLRYLDGAADSAIFRPSIWVILLFIGPVSRSLAFQHYIFNSTRLIIRTKLSLVQLIYEQAMRGVLHGTRDALPTADPGQSARTEEENGAKKQQSAVGRILNHTAYDVDSIYRSRDIFYVSSVAPIELVIGITFLYKLLGWPSLVGMSIMALCVPVPRYLSRRMSMAQKAAMTATDVRISLIAEYLAAVRIIKYFAWEPFMISRVDDARALEQRRLWRRAMYSMSISIFGDLVPLITLFVMFSTYTTVRGEPLRSSIAFPCLTVTELLRQQFTWISNVTRYYAQAVVGLRRLGVFLANTPRMVRPPAGPPSFNNATFRRTPTADFRLENLTIDFKENALNVIAGPTGSGKTSILLSLLGETLLEDGTVTCPRDVGYSPQTPWLQNISVRDNILFQKEYEEQLYRDIVHACDLDVDFENFEDGDLSSSGENGAYLSGGQRQRVMLARAIYSNCSLLLLDDIFSALDVNTAEKVFHRCFRSDLLKSRTIILVTSAQWVAARAQILVSIQDGRIASVVTNAHKSDESYRGLQDTSFVSTAKSAPQINGTRIQEDELKGRPNVPRLLEEKLIQGRGSRIECKVSVPPVQPPELMYHSLSLYAAFWGPYLRHRGYFNFCPCPSIVLQRYSVALCLGWCV